MIREVPLHPPNPLRPVFVIYGHTKADAAQAELFAHTPATVVTSGGVNYRSELQLEQRGYDTWRAIVEYKPEHHELEIQMEVSEMDSDGTIPAGAARITDVLVDGKSIQMDLDEAERIGNAATPGPWYESNVVIGSDALKDEYVAPLYHYYEQDGLRSNDAKFVIFARNHWPEIIAGLRERDRLLAFANRFCPKCDQCKCLLLDGYVVDGDKVNDDLMINIRSMKCPKCSGAK